MFSKSSSRKSRVSAASASPSPSPLHNKRAKKSINALVIASSAAASIALPALFHSISTLRTTTNTSTTASTSSRRSDGNTHNATSRTQTAPNYRAQSLHIVPSTASAQHLHASRPVGAAVESRLWTRTMNVKMNEATSATAVMGVGGQPTETVQTGAITSHQIPHSITPSKDLATHTPTTIIPHTHDTTTTLSPTTEEDWDVEFDLSESRGGVNGPVARLIMNGPINVLAGAAESGCKNAAPPLQLQGSFKRRVPVNGSTATTAVGGSGHGTHAQTKKDGGRDTRHRLVPFEKRRIQSAPSMAQQRLRDEMAGAGSGLTDALLEDVAPMDEDDFEADETIVATDEFVVASVKQKVVARRERELERSISADGGLESWDDDFNDDEKDGGRLLVVPESVLEIQQSLKMEASNFKRFALHIEDLKLLFTDAKLMAKGLSGDKPEQMAVVNKHYAAHLEKAQVLMDLGEFSEMVPDNFVSDERNLRVLSEIISTSTATTAGTTTAFSSSTTLCELRDIAVKCGKLNMGMGVMPVLLQSVGAAKTSLTDYMNELRRIART